MHSCTCAYGRKPETLEIYFAGFNISSTYLKKLYYSIEGKDVSINVISKSGTTTEPAIVFRLLKDYMEKRYGKEEARKRIFITTDKSRGALKELIEESDDDIIIKMNEDNLDGLNYLNGKTLDYVNRKAMEGVIMAHFDRGVPKSYDKYSSDFSLLYGISDILFSEGVRNQRIFTGRKSI